jgi:ribonuclease HII
MKVAGIDEAGRGSLVGPLVIAGLMVDEGVLEELAVKGITDSKLLSHDKRAEFEKYLKKSFKYEIVKIMPHEIDSGKDVGNNLNLLEAMKMADIINRLNPDKVYVDSPGGISKFVTSLKKYLDIECEIVAEYKADLKYPIVGGASILAKQERDRDLRKIEKETGVELGVGYPHDERTINGVKDNLKNGKLKKHIRKSWSTWGRIVEEKEQKKISDW